MGKDRTKKTMNINEWYGIIIILGILLAGIIAAVYVQVYYLHPDDETTEFINFHRFSIISSFAVALFLTFTIALDVATTQRDDTPGYSYNAAIAWTFVLGLIIINVFFQLPLCHFVYHSKKSHHLNYKIKRAVISTSMILFFHLIFIILIRFVVKKSNVYHLQYKSDFKNAKLSSDIRVEWGNVLFEWQDCAISLTFLNSIFIYFAVLGTIFWVFVGGYGLANAPILMLNAWLNKPKYRDAEDFTLTKQVLRNKNEELIEKARAVNDLQNKYDVATGFNNKRKMVFQLRKEKNHLRSRFQIFEDVMKIFEEEENLHESNPLVFIFYLVWGNITLLTSFALMVHTLTMSIPQANGQPMSTMLDGAFCNASKYCHFIIGTTAFLLLCLYLQSALIKGNDVVNSYMSAIAFGMLPFKNNGTWIASFLISASFLLISSFGMLCFLCNNFPQFLRETHAKLFFDRIMDGIPIVGAIYNHKIAELAIIIIFTITCVYLLSRPSEKATVTKEMQIFKQKRSEAMKKDPLTTI